jgi:hypothetical protein
MSIHKMDQLQTTNIGTNTKIVSRAKIKIRAADSSRAGISDGRNADRCDWQC